MDEAQDIIQTHNVVNDIKLKEREVCWGRAHSEKGTGKGHWDSR